MAEVTIKSEGLGKLYRLGEIGSGTLSHDLNRWWYKIRGKEDPMTKIGEINDRTSNGGSDYVWALKDIDFEVKQGEVLGIIGRNGAGKSTLLKILSKITRPTSGKVSLSGRVASLLEVGTGFHPEMTGRENIFMNGAILGMRRSEIKRKFDEIVDFAGIERYIDTPVKRYSSGMYVRLAFGVAAHLEPDILIVDEVLAVGDAEFQQKCLGKMKDISHSDGRTILFVSHNMGSITELCSKLILLKQGQLISEGDTNSIVAEYLNNTENISNEAFFINNRANELAFITRVELHDGEKELRQRFKINESINLKITFKVVKANLNLQLAIVLFNSLGNPLFTSHHTDEDQNSALKTYEPGDYVASFSLRPFFLKAGTYYLSVLFGTPQLLIHDFDHVLSIAINEEIINVEHKGYAKKRPGIVIAQGNWSAKYLKNGT